jgi:hypothetical protein
MLSAFCESVKLLLHLIILIVFLLVREDLLGKLPDVITYLSEIIVRVGQLQRE